MLRREFLNPNMFDQGEAKELKSLLIELYNKVFSCPLRTMN